MSSRRTRSGAFLCSSEQRKLRRIPPRKHHNETSAEDTTIATSGEGASNNADSDLSSEGPVEKHHVPKSKSKPSSPKNTQSSYSNIWERLVTNDAEFMSSAAIREDENKEHDNCTHGQVKTLLTDKAAALDAGTVKKSRKPDILVSLLEGETAYPVSQHKDSVNFKCGSVSSSDDGQDNSKKLREKAVLSEGPGNSNMERHSDTFHVSPSSLCFFHNCECHRNSSLADFSDMPDVPGEPFFVSLSKDENKELNMVKTSSGTVRVGCSLRKLADQKCNFADTSTLVPSSEKSRKMKMSAENKSGRRSGRSPYASEIRFHKTSFDESDNSGWSHQGKKVKDNDLQAIEQRSGHSDLEVNKENVENMYSKHSRSQEMRNTEYISSEDSYSSSETTPDKHKASVLSENRLRRNDMSASSHSKSLTACRSSHYPLMKEILTQQSYVPLSATPNTQYVVSPPELKMENSEKRSQKSGKTLKPSKSAVSFTSVLGTDSDSENKNVVKRSERIRSKSGVEKPISIALHKSVISTMKPLDRTFRDKAKLTNLKKSSKGTFNRESQRKSGKKVSEHVKKAAVVKDVQKGKAAMSREVMEAIIQSIEETVSGCSGAEKTDDILESVPKDILVTSCSMDDIHPHSTSIMTRSSIDLLKMDHWSDCVNDHNYDISNNSADTSYALTKNPAQLTDSNTLSNGHEKASKLFNSKNTVRKARRSAKSSDRSKALKVRSKVRPLTAGAVLEDTPLYLSTTAADSTGNSDIDSTSVVSATSSAGKRFRKKTRKAKEAFGEDDVFSDDSWSLKKSKTNTSSTSYDSSNSNSQRRPRRSSQIGSNIADPVLEEHAFILWASENRSQLEQQHPSASSSEVDTFLFLRWCEVADSLKAKFFLRAREAFSDDERNLIRSGSVTDLEASMSVNFFSDSEPVFTDFIRLPTERQRDMLRKWLKFFQKTLPKKEYIDFIITFKRACNRDSRNPSAGSKRTRMRCLDPSYYKMLFDMIRVTKPRVLEVFKVKQDRDKAALADAYSVMLLKMVNNEPMAPLEPSSKSQALTEILQDLGIADGLDVSLNTGVLAAPSDCSFAIGSCDKNGNDAVCKEDARNEMDTSLASHQWRTVTDFVNKVPLTLEIKAELRYDCSFDESDYSLLNCDLAVNLLSGLSEISELPILDQDTLDQVFLAPPRMSASFSQPKRTVNLYSRCLETLPQTPATGANHSQLHAPPCMPRLLPTDQMPYPKINIQYTPSTSTSIVHHLPIRHNILPHKYRRDTCDASTVRGSWYRKNSPMDMHSYSTSMENMIQSPAHFNEPHSKCFKVHAKVMSPQIKFNLQPVQLPINSRSQQQNRLHPRIIPVSCSLQQRFPTIVYSPTNPALLDKLGSHHMNQAGARSLSSSASSSRISPQPIGLNTPSSLITSLSPLRSIKYSHNNKLYSPHCQMVPYRPRMQLMTGNSCSSQRRTTHTVPISTTTKAGGSKTHSNLQQIKVCLATQTLKIPIAKLREPRKNSYVKGKVKSFNIQHSSLEPYGGLPCSQACQFSVRANPSTSVLAKVLNFQTVNEMEHLSKISLPDGLSNNTSNTGANSRPVNSTFIGTMKPVNLQSSSKGMKPTTQLQFMSVVSSTSMAPEFKPTDSGILTDSHTINRNSYLLEPLCNTRTVDSSSHLLKCSLAPSMYCVSLASVNANTVQNSNLATSGKEPGGSLVLSEASAASGGHYVSAVLDHGGKSSDINGEFRVVGTRVVNTLNKVRGNNMVNNNHAGEALARNTGSFYLSGGSENMSASLEHTATAKKVTLDEETRLDDVEMLSGGTTAANLQNLEFNQERDTGAPTPTKVAYAVAYNSQHCVSKQSLNHVPSTVDHFLLTSQNNTQTSSSSAYYSEGIAPGCGNQNTCFKPDVSLRQDSGGSLQTDHSMCDFTDSEDGLHEVSAANTFPDTRDIPGLSKGFAGEEEMCQCGPACDSQAVCESPLHEGDSEPVRPCSSVGEVIERVHPYTLVGVEEIESVHPSTSVGVEEIKHVHPCTLVDGDVNGGEEKEHVHPCTSVGGDVSVGEEIERVHPSTSGTGDVNSGEEINADNSVTFADGSLRSDSLFETVNSGFIGSSSMTCGRYDSTGSTLHQLQKSNLDSAEKVTNVAINKNIPEDCIPETEDGQVCQHECSVGVPSIPQGVPTCDGTTSETPPSGCASGLQILAETATSSTCLVSARSPALPADQIM